MAGKAGSRGGRGCRGRRGRRGGHGQIIAPPRSPSPSTLPKDFDPGTKFAVAIHLGMPRDRLLLPRGFVTLIDDEAPPLVMLRENDFKTIGYPVDLQFDHLGQMYLGNGWECFARSHQIEAGKILIFKYDGGEGKFGVSVFDHIMCRRCYSSDSSDSSSDSDE